MSRLSGRFQPRDERGRFRSWPSLVEWNRKLGRPRDLETKVILSRGEVQRRSDEEEAEKRRYLVIWTWFETKEGKRTGRFMELELVVRALNPSQAAEITAKVIGKTLPEEMMDLWEEHQDQWHEGITAVDEPVSKVLRFRKFREDGSEYYTKEFEI